MGSDAPSSPQLRPRTGIFGGQAFVRSGRAALSPDSPTTRALFPLPGATCGFVEWCLVVRDLASAGISPTSTAWLVGPGVAWCALALPPARLQRDTVYCLTPLITLYKSRLGAFLVKEHLIDYKTE